jgi:hypothetical protein
VTVITEFDAGDPEATMHALADELLRCRYRVWQLMDAIELAGLGTPVFFENGLLGLRRRADEVIEDAGRPLATSLKVPNSRPTT